MLVAGWRLNTCYPYSYRSAQGRLMTGLEIMTMVLGVALIAASACLSGK